MAIKTILEGVRDTLRKTDNYDSSNTDIGAYKVINTGMKGGRAAVILTNPSTHGADPESPFGINRSHHGVLIEVYRRYVQNTSYSDLINDVDTVITTLNKYPLLNGTTNVIDSEVTETSEVFALPTADAAGIACLGMTVTMEVVESVTTNAVE